jgi:hypothetical protein
MLTPECVAWQFTTIMKHCLPTVFPGNVWRRRHANSSKILFSCLKAGNETCYKGQEYIKPPPLEQNKTKYLVVQTTSYAATNMTNAGGPGGLLNR